MRARSLLVLVAVLGATFGVFSPSPAAALPTSVDVHVRGQGGVVFGIDGIAFLYVCDETSACVDYRVMPSGTVHVPIDDSHTYTAYATAYGHVSTAPVALVDDMTIQITGAGMPRLIQSHVTINGHVEPDSGILACFHPPGTCATNPRYSFVDDGGDAELYVNSLSAYIVLQGYDSFKTTSPFVYLPAGTSTFVDNHAFTGVPGSIFEGTVSRAGFDTFGLRIAGVGACPNPPIAPTPPNNICPGVKFNYADANGDYRLRLGPPPSPATAWNVGGFIFIDGVPFLTHGQDGYVPPAVDETIELDVSLDRPEPPAPAVVTGEPGETVTVSADGGVLVQNVVTAPTEHILTPRPPGVDFPFGVQAFTASGVAPGDPVDITLTFEQALPVGAQWYKLRDGEWTVYPDVTRVGDHTLVIHLVDGGAGDDDGSVNEFVTDPGAVGAAFVEPPTEPIVFGPVRYESRQYSDQPYTAATVASVFRSLPTGVSGFCTAALSTLDGTSNAAACGGISGGLGAYARMHFTTAEVGPWSFRFAPDAGGGGVLLIDGVPVDVAAGDADAPEGGFWDPEFLNPAAHFDGTLELGAGAHVIELYEFEGCCDGPWGAQLRQGEGGWTSIPAGANEPDGDLDGFADLIDGCPGIADPLQADADGDMVTDACDIVLNQPPTITHVDDITIEAHGPDGSLIDYARPTAFDPEDGDLPVVCSHGSPAVYPIGTSTVTCGASDSGGLVATTEFDVTVTDLVIDVVARDVEVVEGPTGSQTHFEVTLELSSPSPVPVKVTLTSSNGTAKGGSDYKHKAGVVVRIPAGQTSVTAPWSIYGDNHDEPIETFHINLSAPVGAELADSVITVGILDDDGPAMLSVVGGEVLEGNGFPRTNAHALFRLDSIAQRDITISWRLTPLSSSADDFGGTRGGTVVLRAGQIQVQRNIDIVGDQLPEGDEDFLVEIVSVQIASGQGAITFGALSAPVVIHDDDEIAA